MFGHQNDQAASKVVPEEAIHVGTDGPVSSGPVEEPSRPAATPLKVAEPGQGHPAPPPAPLTHSPHTYNPGPDDDPVAADNSTHELIDIKQQALSQLSPLVGHLDQSPVDKFRTTMMMIQASDDHTLIKTAYEAAKSIEDEKLRAQALLDIVNEINYFTQHHAA